MTRARRIAVVLGVFAVAWAASPAFAAAPPAAAVQCGQVITSDTTLANDLVDCPGTALTIGADGVTLDLGGHLVDGTNASGSEGIAVDGRTGVTIRRGTVREFRVNGVALRDAGDATVADLTVSAIGAGGVEGEDVSAGIFVRGSDDVDLRDNRVSNDVDAFQADGIVVLASKRVELKRNDTSANAWNGMVVVDSPRARVLSNRTVGNGNSGIFVASAPSVRIARNVAGDHEKPDTAGIAMLQVTGGVVVGNRLRGNRASGIALENGTTSTTVARNRIRGGGDGIAVFDSNDNTVVRNRVMDAGGFGIVLDEFFAEDGSDGNTIAHNSLSRGGVAGILVTGPSTSNTLSENLASRNASDGIRVRTAGNQLERNTANRNRRRGIDAVAGTVDAGGNRASGNGLSPQCTGVSC